MYAVMSPFKVLLHNHPRAHDDMVILVEEEEHVTGQNLKQAESHKCTKNKT